MAVHLSCCLQYFSLAASSSMLYGWGGNDYMCVGVGRFNPVQVSATACTAAAATAGMLFVLSSSIPSGERQGGGSVV